MDPKSLNFKKIDSEILLRVGLGLIFIYAGLQSLLDPSSWIGFLPYWLTPIIHPAIAIKIHAIISLIVGFSLLAGFRLKLFSVLAFLELAAILIFYGVDNVTFRDFGLATAAIALFLISSEK